MLKLSLPKCDQNFLNVPKTQKEIYLSSIIFFSNIWATVIQFYIKLLIFFSQISLKFILEKSVAGAQPQQPSCFASSPLSLVTRSPRTSSATVGWIPTVWSSCSLVIPHLIDMARPYVISPAPGERIWNPTTLFW